jgi:TonB family protein
MMRLTLLAVCLSLFLAPACLATDFRVFSLDSNAAFPQINLAIDRDSITQQQGLTLYRIRWYDPYTNRVKAQDIVANCESRRRGQRARNETPDSVSLYSVYPNTLLATELDIACGLTPAPNLAPIAQISKAAAQQGAVKSTWTPEEIDGSYRTASHGGALALDDLKHAAEQGYTQAQLDLGELYGSHLGAGYDYVESMKWYAKAIPDLRQRATAGEAAAQFELGRLTLEGLGVAPDRASAMHWLRAASEQGNVPAKLALARAYSSGVETGPKTLQAARADAARLGREAAEAGNAEAQYFFGSLYETGAGGVRNYEAALNWYRKSAAQGYALAQYKLGMAYLKGDWGVPQDDVQAGKWLLQAASQGNVNAAYQIGELYFKGKGVEQDDTQAAEWITFAAKGYNASAQARLAGMYREGHGVPKDADEADKWQAMADRQIHPSPPYVSARNDQASLDLNGCRPAYPPSALPAKEAGKVRIVFSVGADDRLLSSDVVSSSGFADLDQAALKALRLCKFTAGKNSEGKPMQSSLNFEYAWTPEQQAIQDK